jgi:hypothetical protein
MWFRIHFVSTGAAEDFAQQVAAAQRPTAAKKGEMSATSE